QYRRHIEWEWLAIVLPTPKVAREQARSESGNTGREEEHAQRPSPLLGIDRPHHQCPQHRLRQRVIETVTGHRQPKRGHRRRSGEGEISSGEYQVSTGRDPTL